MFETYHISQLLAPELQAEIDITRRILSAVPVPKTYGPSADEQ